MHLYGWLTLTTLNVCMNQTAKAAARGAEGEVDDFEEEERARETQALAARADFEERLAAVRPGDYQLQVIPQT